MTAGNFSNSLCSGGGKKNGEFVWAGEEVGPELRAAGCSAILRRALYGTRLFEVWLSPARIADPFQNNNVFNN